MSRLLDCDSVGDPRALREYDASYAGRRDPGAPTKHPPGTPGKLVVMEARANRREALFHARDATIRDRAVCNPLTLGNGSDPLRALVSVDEHALVPTEEEMDADDLAREWEQYDRVRREWLAAHQSQRGEATEGKAA